MTAMKTRCFQLAIESLVVCLVASQPALATDPTPNWCKGVRIAAFSGGYEPGKGDRYSEAVYNGYRQAALDLGPTVAYYFSHWSPDEMIHDFRRAIDEKVDGVALIAFGYNAALNSLLHKAFAQGTIVISAAVELRDDEKAYSSEGMGYVGPSTEAFSNTMAANPGIKAVFIEHGFLTENFALIAKDLKRGQVYVVGSELSPKAMTAVKDGYLNLAADEQPYLNGYLPILNICLTKRFGFSGLHFNRGVIFVDSSNVDAVGSLVDQGIR